MEKLLTSLVLLLVPAASGQFLVHAPVKELVAEVGSDILLPCTLTPKLAEAGLEVRWFHKLFTNIVFLLKDGTEGRQQQSPRYRGRASMNERSTTGNVSLFLHNVQLSDTGKYHCLVENSTTEVYEEDSMELHVVGSGSPPLVAVALQGSSVVISCSSDGWFPRPTMFWKMENGVLKPSDPENDTDNTELIRVKSRMLLNHSSEGRVYCGFRHPVTAREIGSYVTVSDDMFPRTSPWAIVFWLLLIVTITLSAGMAWFFYSRKRNHEMQLKEKDICIERLRWEVEWRTISTRKESILFDPLTAYHGLMVSPDGRHISSSENAQDVPQNDARFDTEPCVLGQTSFQHGTHYWETEISENNGRFWAIGVAIETVRRTGGQRECPEAGIWAIRGTPEGYYALSTPPETIILRSHSSRPCGPGLLNGQGIHGPRRLQRVGTLLDYERGKVSFYDVETYEPLYIFEERFSHPVYPFYYVGPGISFSLLNESP
ncbi:butyrophilin subfamily 1 member A1-like [Bufo gargarizans]|uniref:butyrophilin subfamily 1 member A1-like n=1 Tax=Bufo gargarizans TaxID=30331 RepID=UPI001CF2762D|nr:butyrophilin subfamily 1 member A1-like [Bufo gargarizans]XP_044161585.1 butyrophilin subfamily 1 member A1-like [Bufo gargarizans]